MTDKKLILCTFEICHFSSNTNWIKSESDL